MDSAYDQLALMAWDGDGGFCAVSTDATDEPNLAANAPGTVYRALAEHQIHQAWDDQELLAWLQHWAELFIFEFKLQVSRFALSVDWLHQNRLGHFRHGHNGFGLQGEIAINRRYLDRDASQILGTLLHELLHAEQEEHGTPGKNNYHNIEFRRRALEFGLLIDERGVTQYAGSSRFKTLLEKHGVGLPRLSPPKAGRRKGSKLKLWMCPCKVRVRVAVSDFQASCLKCGGVFAMTDKLGLNNGHLVRNAAEHAHADSPEGA